MAASTLVHASISYVLVLITVKLSLHETYGAGAGGRGNLTVAAVLAWYILLEALISICYTLTLLKRVADLEARICEERSRLASAPRTAVTERRLTQYDEMIARLAVVSTDLLQSPVFLDETRLVLVAIAGIHLFVGLLWLSML